MSSEVSRPFKITIDDHTTVKVCLLGSSPSDENHTSIFVSFGVPEEFIKPKTSTSIHFEMDGEYPEPENCFYKIDADLNQKISIRSEATDISGKGSFVDFKFAENGSVDILDFREIILSNSSATDEASDLESVETPTLSSDESNPEAGNYYKFGPHMDIKRKSTILCANIPVYNVKCSYYNGSDHKESNASAKIERVFVYRPFSKIQSFILVK